MLRIAPALLLVLAGCTGLPGDDSRSAVPILAILNELNAELRLSVETRDGSGDIQGARAYTVPPEGAPILTPPARLDPHCDHTTSQLRMLVATVGGAQLNVRSDPVACGEPITIEILASDGAPHAVPLPWPEGWQRGDVWPEEGDSGWQQPGDASDTPSISFHKDATNDRLRIVNADEDANWYDIRIDLSGCTARLHQGDQSSGTTSGQRVTSYRTPVSAGDYIALTSTPCTVKLTHVPSDYEYNTWSY